MTDTRIPAPQAPKPPGNKSPASAGGKPPILNQAQSKPPTPPSGRLSVQPPPSLKPVPNSAPPIKTPTFQPPVGPLPNPGKATPLPTPSRPPLPQLGVPPKPGGMPPVPANSGLPQPPPSALKMAPPPVPPPGSPPRFSIPSANQNKPSGAAPSGLGGLGAAGAGAAVAGAGLAAATAGGGNSALPPKGPSSVPPASTPPSGQTPLPKLAELKQSPLRFLPFIVGGLVVLGVVILIASKLLSPKPTPVQVANTSGSSSSETSASPAPGSTGNGFSLLPSGNSSGQTITLTYWGLWEPSTVLQDVISQYEQTHPGIKIEYQQESYQNYRERLETAIVSNKGPDIFRFHASWEPMMARDLAPAPSSVIAKTDFDSTFYPVASKQLEVNGQVVGVPLMYEGLALFYNQDILKTANAQPPTTWRDLKSLASQLTIRDKDKIQRAGVALGNTSNVDNFSDILGLLMLQNGADPTKPNSQAAQDAMVFYTNFVKTDKVWDSTFPNSTTAFARGDVAMIIAPSWRAHDIKAANPNLNFAIAPIPQLLSNNKVTWASYWAEGVSAQSPHQTEAWEFLKYMSSADTLRKLYAAASKERAFGEIYPRKDMATDLASDPYVSAYLSDASYAQDWYLNSMTHDDGLNDQLIKYYEDAVNAVDSGADVGQTMGTVQQGSDQILRQYSIPTTP